MTHSNIIRMQNHHPILVIQAKFFQIRVWFHINSKTAADRPCVLPTNHLKPFAPHRPPGREDEPTMPDRPRYGRRVRPLLPSAVHTVSLRSTNQNKPVAEERQGLV